MNNIRISFVILHYKTADDTIKCIESIRQLDKQVHIVVVDNASGNGSIEKVEERFKETKEIYYVKNKEIFFKAGAFKRNVVIIVFNAKIHFAVCLFRCLLTTCSSMI